MGARAGDKIQASRILAGFAWGREPLCVCVCECAGRGKRARACGVLGWLASLYSSDSARVARPESVPNRSDGLHRQPQSERMICANERLFGDVRCAALASSSALGATLAASSSSEDWRDSASLRLR